jgi:hypothetical protein
VCHAGRMGGRINSEYCSVVKEGNTKVSAMGLAEEMGRGDLFEGMRVEGRMGVL